ncbi:MAG TPA: glycosyltransferase [Thermoflexus sp.]|nr:glycosyltransferase [Thermoflexus sp.]
MKPQVLFISGRETEYIRNRVLLAALQRYCNVTVLTGYGRNIITRSVSGLLKWSISRPAYDVVLAGFYGQLIAIILALLQRQPVILDAYVSTYDTLCEDRKLFHPRSLPGRLAYWIDQKSLQLADIIITDTRANAQYFSQQFGISCEKFRVIYVGCDESLFYPRSDISPPASRCEVFYYGSFLPLHGIEIIVQAAELLKNYENIHFTLGGNGPLFKSIKRMVEDLRLTNVDLVGWIPLERLPFYVAGATICLGGHFSKIPKAARVISTKTFQFIAMRKSTVVGDSRAIRELFVPGEHVYAVPMGDPAALAEAIRVLAEDTPMRNKIANGGYALFRERLTTRVIAEQLRSLIEEVRCVSVL